MIGINELRLNQSTICEAVSYWLVNKVLNPNDTKPVVKSVHFIAEENAFAVKLDDSTVPL